MLPINNSLQAKATSSLSRLVRPLALLLFALAALAVLGTPGAAPAPGMQRQSGATLERNVKAAFLYKFLGYTQFPADAFADPGTPIVIGVLGSDEMAAELRRIAVGRTIQNRAVNVKLLHDQEARGTVHLLFIAGADSARAGRLLNAMQPGPTLLVTECDNGLLLGGVINFRIVDEHVRFDVSLEAAEKNNIKLSSRLLTVANHVQKGSP